VLFRSRARQRCGQSGWACARNYDIEHRAKSENEREWKGDGAGFVGKLLFSLGCGAIR